MNASDRRSRVLIGRFCDRTGVQHNEFSIPTFFCKCEPLLLQLAFNGRPVRLGRTATEVLNVKFAHGAIIATTTSRGLCVRRQHFWSAIFANSWAASCPQPEPNVKHQTEVLIQTLWSYP